MSLVGLLSAACGATCVAGGDVLTRCAKGDPTATIRALPDSVDAVLVVEGAALQRRTAAGRALGDFVGEAGFFQRTAKAWASLGGAMRLSSEEAFDAALGDRAIVVIDNLYDTDAAQWAVISTVCPQTEARLRRALRPAPRGFVNGKPVLAIDGGAYELAITTDGIGERDRLILLASSGDHGLFDALVPVLDGIEAARPLGACAGFEYAAKAAGSDVMLYLRRSVADRAEFMVCGATQSENGWTATCTATPGMMWSGAGGIPSADFPARLDGAAGGRAVMSYVGPMAGLTGARDLVALGVPVLSGASSELRSKLGSSVAMWVLPQDGGVTLRLAFRSENLAELAPMADRHLGAALEQRCEPADAAEPVLASVAHRSAPAIAARSAPAVFSSLPRSEPRVVEISPAPGESVRAGSATLAWGYQPDVVGADRGWWFVSLTQGLVSEKLGRNELRALKESVAGGRQPVEAGLVSRGAIYPGAAVSMLDGGQSAFLKALCRIERVSWEIRKGDDGLLTGKATLETGAEHGGGRADRRVPALFADR